MNKKPLLRLALLGVLLWILAGMTGGCSSGMYSGSIYASHGYGGMYDPFFYDRWYHRDTIVVRPPPIRPPRPTPAPMRPVTLPAPIPGRAR
ncbi:MAG: hypothetical protein R6U56_08440 [Opitutales bacterium]